MDDTEDPGFVSIGDVLTSKYDTSCYHIIIPRKQMDNRRKRPKGYEEFNEDWYLSTRGDMINSWNGYPIYHNQLTRNDWVLHLMAKMWFDANTFIPAYFEACRRIGVKSVDMLLFYS